jgi:predicted RNase H-like HicB family nuclease
MRDVSYYMSLPYTDVIRRDEDGDFIAEVAELPGCAAHGASRLDALDALDEVKRLWIEERLAGGFSVPEPIQDEALPSGKWVQRVPRTVHLKLGALAKREGVSLNHLVSSILSEAIGEKAYRSGHSDKSSGAWAAAASSHGTPWKINHAPTQFVISSAHVVRSLFPIDEKTGLFGIKHGDEKEKHSRLPH